MHARYRPTRPFFPSFVATIGIAALGCAGASDVSTATTPADRVYVGDHIVTLEDAHADATALAVRGEKIVWVGDREDAAAWQGPGTETVELGDRALLPGFIDAHGHLAGQAALVGVANVSSPPVGPVANIEDLQHVLREHIAKNDIAEGEWVLGYGYDDSLLAEGRHPTRHDLDAVSTDHPIALNHVSGHLGAANSRALADVGYTAETPDPAGGTIRRETDGRTPNGVLEETASFALRQKLGGQPTPAAYAAAVAAFAAHGVTTIQDGASSPATVAQLEALDQAGGLAADVVLYPFGMDPKAIPADFAFGDRTPRVKVPGVKLMLDGSPQGKTAYLTEPYHVPPHGKGADYRGYPIVPKPAVERLVAHWAGRGVPIIAHANGDAAADLLIGALAAAAPTHDHRTVMIHSQVVREDQLDRMRDLAIIPSYFSAHTFYWGDWHRDSVLGPERGARISPTRSTVERGMHFTVHNDTPIVPPDMIRLLWATTNRITRSGQVLGPEQRISIEQALRAMTIEGAYQSFDEGRKGSLAVGKQADLVILSANPLETAREDLLGLRVESTLSRGKVVYER